jgi:hypothetical protein
MTRERRISLFYVECGQRARINDAAVRLETRAVFGDPITDINLTIPHSWEQSVSFAKEKESSKSDEHGEIDALDTRRRSLASGPSASMTPSQTDTKRHPSSAFAISTITLHCMYAHVRPCTPKLHLTLHAFSLVLAGGGERIPISMDRPVFQNTWLFPTNFTIDFLPCHVRPQHLSCLVNSKALCLNSLLLQCLD